MKSKSHRQAYFLSSPGVRKRNTVTVTGE